MKHRFALLPVVLGLLPFTHGASAQVDADAGSWHGTGSGTTLTNGNVMTSGGTLTYNNLASVTSTDRTFTLNGSGSTTTTGATLSLNASSYSGATFDYGYSLSYVDFTLNTYTGYNGTGTFDSLTAATPTYNPGYLNPVVSVAPIPNAILDWLGNRSNSGGPTFNMPTSVSVEAGEPFALRINALYPPTEFAAWNLPPGTNFDASEGLVAGFIPTPGYYYLTVGAGNGTGRRTTIITVTVTPPVPALVLKAFAPTASFTGGQNGRFAVYLDKPTTVDLAVNYVVSGTAANGRDTKKLSGVLTIPAGETYGLIDVVPKAALENKGQRTVLLQLAPGNGYSVRAVRTVRVTVGFD